MTLLKILFFPLLMWLWLFRLPWIIYLALAGGVGYFAYLEYENYRFNVFEAELQVAAGVPDPTLLSTWDVFEDVTVNDEVNVQALYFTELSSGTFEPTGVEKGYVLLADDQGREIKAALVMSPSAVPVMERLLTGERGDGAWPVTVNGLLIRDRNYSVALRRELALKNIPHADELLLIEPIVGNRAAFFQMRAQDTILAPLLLSGLAGFLTLYGLIRFLFTRRAPAQTVDAAQSRRTGPAKGSKQPSQKTLPTKAASQASPWGTFKPVDGNASAPPPVPTSQSPDVWPKPATPAKRAKPPAVPVSEPDIPLEPEFESVFPGGGSGFKFKTADEIIRQTFGTLSSLTPPKPRD